MPMVGIGAGPGCDGQVLVLHDLLGLDSGHRRPKFVKDFLAEGGSVAGAAQAYAAAVRDGSFPDAAIGYFTNGEWFVHLFQATPEQDAVFARMAPQDDEMAQDRVHASGSRPST